MAALRVKVEEGELLLQNYEVVPPVLRTYFGKVSEAKGNAEKYDSAFYCALSAVHDVHEELVSVLWEHREKNIQKYVTNSPRVRFADLARSHVKSTQTDELVKGILKTNELIISEDPPFQQVTHQVTYPVKYLVVLVTSRSRRMRIILAEH